MRRLAGVHNIPAEFKASRGVTLPTLNAINLLIMERIAGHFIMTKVGRYLVHILAVIRRMAFNRRQRVCASRNSHPC